jgi:nucleoid-associated protein YgaU
MRRIVLPMLLGTALVGFGCSTHTKSRHMADGNDPLALESVDGQAVMPLAPAADATFTDVAPVPGYAPASTVGYQIGSGAGFNAAGSAGPTQYTVQKGDTLYGLARRFYGDGKLWLRIAEANPGLSEKNFPAGRSITIP